MATRKESASKAANARWAGKTKQERSAIMRATAQKRGVKISPEDLALLSWLRENREAIAALLVNSSVVVNCSECGIPVLRGATCEQNAYLPESTAPVAADVEFETEDPPQVRPGVQISEASRCSICLSPILDLDAPCAACVESGRLKPIPQAGHGQDIAELQQARESAQKLEPAPVVTTEPRISQAINRAPIPPPLPPLRAYVAGETCRNCGRLPELHQDHGGPIGHNHEAQ